MVGLDRAYLLDIFFSKIAKCAFRDPASGFLNQIDPSKIEDPSRNLYRDILLFCLSTDVCERLGVSFMDIMHLDLYSYKVLRDMLRDNPKPEQKELQKTLDKLKL